MARYHLSPEAARDVAEIWQQTAQSSVEAADRVRDALFGVFRTLAEMPGTGRAREDLTRWNGRFKTVWPYLIAYSTSTTPVQIVAVLHGKRDITRVLRERQGRLTRVLPVDPLQAAALRARERAHAPFSKFRVGAAVLDEWGRVHAGCNVENASYGLTMCAERVAVFKAVSEGAKRVTRVAVVADTERLTPPCGACRQILWEFGGDVEVTMGNLAGAVETMRMGELLPRAFDGSFL